MVMKIRADQLQEDEVPNFGDKFTVVMVEKPHVWTLIELVRDEGCQKSENKEHCWIINDKGDIQCVLCNFIGLKNFIKNWKLAGTKVK